MRVAVIGAGIYGCHIASILLDREHQVEIFEKESTIFKNASGNNQFRLHQGYHYARDYKTRSQSKEGFNKFMAKYGNFTKEVEHNYYLVPQKKSLLDFTTYTSIFKSEGFVFEIVTKDLKIDLHNIEGVINVDERIICVEELKKHFSEKIGKNVHFNTKVDEKKLSSLKSKFDYVIDCTWGKLKLFSESFYEVTHLAYCQIVNPEKQQIALTFVDGDLFSLYPTENPEIFTLSHVTHTSLFKSKNFNEIENYMNELTKPYLESNFYLMKRDLVHYYPDFEHNFKYVGDQISIKTKFDADNDPRDCRIIHKENLISIFSGKVDTLFVAEEYILKIII